MTHATQDDLIGLVRGDLSSAEVREVEDHVAGCITCRRELAWLRTERGLFRSQSAPLPVHTWQGIERRIIVAREERSGRRRRFITGGSAAAVFAAAASLLLYVWGRGVPQPMGSSMTVSSQMRNDENPKERLAPSQVLDDAEREYRQAIAKLENVYQSERAELDPDTANRYDDELRQLRDVVSTERARAGDDTGSRRRVLRAYSAYMRSMQSMVLEVRK